MCTQALIDEGQDRRFKELDLMQQADGNGLAQIGNWVGFGSLIVSGLALWLLALSLGATRRAAEAAETASKAALAANEGLAKSAEQQLRAYVGIHDVELSVEFGKFPAIVIVFKNSGQTPGYDFRTQSVARYKLPGTKPDFVIPSFDNGSYPVAVGPQAEKRSAMVLSHEPKLSKEAIDQMALPDGLAIDAFGRCEYRDAFGKKRYTNWRFRSAVIGSTYVMQALPEGNDSD